MQQCRPLESESPPNTEGALCAHIGAVLTQHCQYYLLSDTLLLEKKKNASMDIMTICGRDVHCRFVRLYHM